MTVNYATGRIGRPFPGCVICLSFERLFVGFAWQINSIIEEKDED